MRNVVLVAIAFAIIQGSWAHATVVTFCPSGDTVRSTWETEVPLADCLLGEGAKLCKAWVSTCKKLVRETLKCHVAQAASTAKLEKAKCKLGTVVDPKQCRKDAKDDLKIARDRAKVERAFEFQECEAHFGTCVATCEL